MVHKPPLGWQNRTFCVPPRASHSPCHFPMYVCMIVFGYICIYVCVCVCVCTGPLNRELSPGDVDMSLGVSWISLTPVGVDGVQVLLCLI